MLAELLGGHGVDRHSELALGLVKRQGLFLEERMAGEQGNVGDHREEDGVGDADLGLFRRPAVDEVYVIRPVRDVIDIERIVVATQSGHQGAEHLGQASLAVGLVHAKHEFLLHRAVADGGELSFAHGVGEDHQAEFVGAHDADHVVQLQFNTVRQHAVDAGDIFWVILHCAFLFWVGISAQRRRPPRGRSLRRRTSTRPTASRHRRCRR